MMICEKCGETNSSEKCHKCGSFDVCELSSIAHNALLIKFAAYVRELGDKKMPILRDIVSPYETPYERKQDLLGQTRGMLMESALVERFEERFDTR